MTNPQYLSEKILIRNFFYSNIYYIIASIIITSQFIHQKQCYMRLPSIMVEAIIAFKLTDSRIMTDHMAILIQMILKLAHRDFYLAGLDILRLFFHNKPSRPRICILI